ncbi:MAG: hypothetical protein H3C59_14195 [Burkholderiaceae bacterium]|nr:hypothetical protein [Burkholderiaceae bacterium]
MASVTLSATPKGNGYQATVTYSDGVAISSAEAFPTQAEAISAAALRLLDMPERLERFDAPEGASTDAGMASRTSLSVGSKGAEQKEWRKP